MTGQYVGKIGHYDGKQITVMTQQGTEKASYVTDDTITSGAAQQDNLIVHRGRGISQYVNNDSDVTIGYCNGTLGRLVSTTICLDGTLHLMDVSRRYNEAKVGHCNWII